MSAVKSGRIAAGAVLALALAAPAMAQINQAGRWSAATNQGSPLFVNQSQPAEVMVTVCVDSGIGVNVNVNGGGSPGQTLLVVGNGGCRTALANVGTGGAIIVTPGPAPNASGTYSVSSPVH